MPKSCCVHGCAANKKKNPDLQFYIIPTERSRREKWLTAIGRAVLNPDGTVNKNKWWSPRTGHNYVCSAHFITGAKVNEPFHPDYVPTILPKTSQSKRDDLHGKSTIKVDRYKRAAHRATNRKDPDGVKPNGPSRVRKKLQLVDTNQDLMETPCHWSSEENCTIDDMKFNHQFTRSLDEDIDNDPIYTATPITPMNQPVHVSEREMFYTEIENLRKERDQALERIVELEKIVGASTLSSSSVEENNTACQMMTGVSWDVFMKIFLFLCTCLGSKSTNKSSLPLKEQLFLTLIKLRHNVSFEFLAHVKGIPKSTLIDYFWKWVDLLHDNIGFMVKWSDRESIFAIIPPVFKRKFPRLTSIIDCFEIFIEAPKNLLARAQCYSSYKKHCTIKFLISCSPLGQINFISKAWGGRASDVQIVRDSGFIDYKYHLPGDQILADRGFTLKDDFAAKCSAELLTPSFTKGRKQLPARDLEISNKISSVRIHIERVIGLLKNRFTILKGTLPIRVVQSLKDESIESTLSSCDKILKVCAALVNLGTGIVYKD